MKSTILCSGNILVVGDGDFSFSIALVKHSDLVPRQIFTSNLETETSILHHAQASDNMSSLKALGVSVFLETDATDLHNHPVISKERFERIIFNFPLADRHNIKKNRSLLADFFSSCRSVLAPGGCVLVTLCKGQGGTPADQPIRSWHDSWQVVAMATNASFLLREVLPFDPADFPEYHSVGFRFQDKSFNVTGALTHIFEMGTTVEDCDVSIRGVVHSDGMSYSCSSYVAGHLNRNLLEEPRNPISILRHNLEERFQDKNNIVVIENSCSPVIPSHRSTAWFCNEVAEGSDSTSGLTRQPDTICDKAWKDSENLKRMIKTQLAHGVVSETNGTKTEDSGCSEDTGLGFLTNNRDNVYILVKSKDSMETKNSNEEEMEFDTSQESESSRSSSSTAAAAAINITASHSLSNSCDGSERKCNSQIHPQDISADGTESSSPIYHCRTSLLENLHHLCKVMNDKAEVLKDSHTSDSYQISMRDDSNNKDFPTSETNLSELNSKGSCARIPSQNISFPCLLASGQSMLPCHIIPNSSPIKHEMLILHKIDNHQSNNDFASSLGESCATRDSNQSQFDIVSSKIVSLLHPLQDSLPASLSLTKWSQDSRLNKVNIEGIDESNLLGQINLTDVSSEEDTSPSDTSYKFSDVVGFVLHAKIADCSYHVTVLNLQQIVCRLCKIEDWRLLWSDSDKFLNQFQSKKELGFNLCQFRPFSLYPMKFVHDLSFWEQKQEGGDDSESTFDVFSLYEAIRSVAGDLVTNVSLMDVYKEPETNRRSRCYRLHFLSSDKCLPYVTSWKVQSKIRMEVARSLGVQLR